MVGTSAGSISTSLTHLAPPIPFSAPQRRPLIVLQPAIELQQGTEQHLHGSVRRHQASAADPVGCAGGAPNVRAEGGFWKGGPAPSCPSRRSSSSRAPSSTCAPSTHRSGAVNSS